MRVTNPKTGRKIEGFPLFTDVDLEYFNIFRRAKDPLKRRGIILLKPRRTGFSYKNAGLATYEYNFYRDSVTCVGAYENKWSAPFIGAVMTNLNFLVEHTCWNKPRNPDQLAKDYCKAQHQVTTPESNKIWKGYMSEIWRLTFKDNPGASAGKSTSLFFFEEAGQFDNILESYALTEPTWMDGNEMVGTPVIYGCVCKGTKVWTANGKQVNIEDLKQKQGIIGYGGIGAIQQPIIWMKPPAKKSCYRIETINGGVIECSNDHPLLWSKNKWETSDNRKKVTFKRADELKVGEQLMSSVQVPIFGKDYVEHARFFGMMVGDGNYTTNQIPQLSIGDEEIYHWLVNEFPGQTSVYKTFTQKSGKIYRSVGIKKIQDKFKKLGIYGQVKELKNLPSNYLSFNLETICEFLGGYFDADGSVSYNEKKNVVRVSLTSKYKHLLEQVKELLFKLGVDSAIIKENRKSGYLAGTIYRLYISKQKDVRQFHKHIKFITKHKQETLNKILTINKTERYYYENCLFVKSESTTKGTYYLDNDTPMNSLKANTITKIEFIGEKEVYNLNADITHTYLTNNFISGNTGGDMGKGAIAFSQMFYDPDKYNLLAFDNIWEDDKVNQQCGWFLPASRQRFGELRDEKKNLILDKNGKVIKLVDEEGNSNELAAKEDVLNYRKSKKFERTAITEYPLVPSEGFLITTGNTFPTILLKERLGEIRANPDKYILPNWVGDLAVNSETGEIEQRLNLEKTPLRRYPIGKEEDITGCLEIFEQPQKDDGGRVFSRRYIVACDPYDDDQVVQSDSLGCVLVFDRLTRRVVAEYTGRRRASELYEIFRKLIIYYNGYGLGFPEINKIGIVNYFENKNSLHMLAETPLSLRDKVEWKPNLNTSFGYKANQHTNNWGNELINDWLLEELEPGSELKNLNRLRSTGLIEELIKYNPDGNFDRISTMRAVLILDTSIRRQKVKTEQKRIKSFSEDEWFKEIGVFDDNKSYTDPNSRWDSLINY
jgi:intein/homing endonuclease